MTELSDREIDALVAEKVMGWTMGEIDSATEGLWLKDGHPTKWDRYDWQPAINIGCAWEVVEKLKDGNYAYIRWVRSMVLYECVFNATIENEKVIATAKTAPRAICLAALRSVQGGGDGK